MLADIAGDTRAGWGTAVPDWKKRIAAGRSLIPTLPLFEKVADRALEIFKGLRVPDMIGTPTYGEACDDWVFDFVRAIFGSYDPVKRERMIREFFLLVPKKNGKSSIGAAIILTAAILNDRPQNELVLIAPTQKIANIAFKQIRGMIALDPELLQIFKVQAHLKQITHMTTEAVIMILSADGNVVTGSKAGFILIDETHVLGTQHKAPDIFLELRGGMDSKPEGFLLQITTQSKKEPSGQFKKELMRARSVRDGTATHPMLAVLYELPPEMAKDGGWENEATWGMVNPNLGRSVTIQGLQEKHAAAKQDGPEALALFASQHLNVEVGIGLHSERWIAADYWPSCAETGLTLDSLMDRSEVVVVGGDIGGAYDLLSIGVIGRCKETRNWLHWTHAWCIPDVLQKLKEIAPKLLDLQEVGDVTIDADIDQHVSDVCDICDQIKEAGLFPDVGAIGFDPHGTAAMLDELVERGYPEPPEHSMIFGVEQGYKLNRAVKTLERRTYQGSLRHGDQPLMTWCMGNAKAEARGQNTMITKAKAGSAKIDPLIGLFNATILMDMNPVAAKRADLNAFLNRPVMIA